MSGGVLTVVMGGGKVLLEIGVDFELVEMV